MEIVASTVLWFSERFSIARDYHLHYKLRRYMEGYNEKINSGKNCAHDFYRLPVELRITINTNWGC